MDRESMFLKDSCIFVESWLPFGMNHGNFLSLFDSLMHFSLSRKPEEDHPMADIIPVL